MELGLTKILISEEQIQTRVRELAHEIAIDHLSHIGSEGIPDATYTNQPAHLRPERTKLLVVSVLRGSFVFVADLIRALNMPCQVDFMAVSSYGDDTQSSGKVKIEKDISAPIHGRHVLLVDDILDSGHTMAHLTEMLLWRHPASFRTAVLLNKPSRRIEEIEADYVGFTIPDEFVVGYGLDYAQDYRELPYIGVLNPAI